MALENRLTRAACFHGHESFERLRLALVGCARVRQDDRPSKERGSPYRAIGWALDGDAKPRAYQVDFNVIERDNRPFGLIVTGWRLEEK